MTETYLVKLPVFEGPFELLFHLIEKEEVDIRDIPIAKITAEYLEYLAQMRELNLEIASEFLVMAATLIRIKARMLVPVFPAETGPENEDAADPREELTARLMVYKRFRSAAAFLNERRTRWQRTFPKGAPGDRPLVRKKVFPTPVGEYGPEDLRKAIASLLKAYRTRNETLEVARTDLDLAERMLFILTNFRKKQVLKFSELSRTGSSNRETAANFLAMLELVRRRRLSVAQTETFGEIFMRILDPSFDSSSSVELIAASLEDDPATSGDDDAAPG